MFCVINFKKGVVRYILKFLNIYMLFLIFFLFFVLMGEMVNCLVVSKFFKILYILE